MDEIKISVSQKIFGRIAYWIAIICGVLAIVVTVLILLFPENNVLNPSTAFAAIFDGASPQEIWAYSDSGTFPGAHFYLEYITRFDSWAMIIIVVGSAFGLFALLPAIIYQVVKERDWFCAASGAVIAVLIALSMAGILSVGT